MAAAVFRAAVLALACAACTSIEATQATFEGTRWRIAAINGAPTPVYVVWFSGTYIRGNICNHFEASYRVSGDRLALSGFMNTERGCSSPTSDYEDAAFAVLHRPMTLRWSSDRQLTLSNSAGSIVLERTERTRSTAP